jgi:hypothetical protein
MDNVLDHYQSVLRDLETRRNRYQKELADIEQTIGGIKRIISTTASLFVSTPIPASIETPLAHGDGNVVAEMKKYAGMSVRWAVLRLLAEDAPGPLKTVEIAALLSSGGISSASMNFAGNVSAVVSDMVNKRKELESAEDSSYRLTDNGRAAWAAIKHSPKYVNRSPSHPTLQ